MKTLFPYGLDAPPVVRNLSAAAVVCWLGFAASFIPSLPLRVDGLAWPALSFSFGAGAMVWSSRYGKLRRREQLLDRLPWRGNERVLDIGCGRGLMAVAAARRVPTGHVSGLDIWQSSDLSGNHAQALSVNAARECVGSRIATLTADMRWLPLADASIDTVVSSMAIHNLAHAEARAQAIAEIVRVLKPGGLLLIDDIRHLRRHAEQLDAAGMQVALRRDLGHWGWRLLSLGRMAPGTLIGCKSVSEHRG
ncbi:MAG: class I SAM-dependent methyltransferase [Dyella sp.]